MNPFFELFFLLFDLYTMVVLLRFFMQYFRVDYYNPFSQFVVKLTDPLIKPLRKMIPGFAGIDWSSMLLSYAFIMLKLLLLLGLVGALGQMGVIAIILQSLLNLSLSIINLFTYLILIRVILSWVSPGGYSPVALLFSQLTEPLIRPFRQLLPSSGGMDFSPMLAGIALFFLGRLLGYYVQPLISGIS